MTTPFLKLLLAGTLLALVQGVAAIPWIWGLDPRGFRRWIKDPTLWLYWLGAVVLLGLGLAVQMTQQRIEASLKDIGYYYGSVLHVQLALDFLVLAPQLLLLVWPKGGAVALSSFREGWRQPMFWLIIGLATALILASMVIPYFTFGEDYKMMKQLGYDVIMLSATLFGLLAASLSINEEIEGRTAITVMSKPINRRQFLLGKYAGALLACWAMTLFLGWVFTWALYLKPHFDKLDDIHDQLPIEVVKMLSGTQDGSAGYQLMPTPEGNAVAQGAVQWFGETLAHHLGLLLSFGQVMVLLAICTALATRLQFVINLVICAFIFFIGHLAPVLVHVTQDGAQQGDAALKLVNFIARFIDVVFPGLEYFDMGPAIIRDIPLEFGDFAVYVATVLGYATLYSAIAMIAGLFLFEDRDLA
jgi:hypothetical protein